MRRLFFFLAFTIPFAIALPTAQAEGNFAGVWTAAVCPRGVAAAPGQCSQFVLELYQKQGKLCGAHVFATAGAGMVDEAANPSTPSVSGEVSDTGEGGDTGNASNGSDHKATVYVASSRSKAPRGVEAELKLSRGMLLWKRLDKPGRDELLPLAAQFTRSRHKTLMAPMFAQQLAAACSLVAIPGEPAPVQKPEQEQPTEAPRAPETTPPPEPRKDS